MKDAPESETSGTAPDSPGTCKFKKVLLSGLPPGKSEVEAMMKSLDARRASRRAPETAKPRPQAFAESDALATVIAISSRQK